MANLESLVAKMQQTLETLATQATGTRNREYRSFSPLSNQIHLTAPDSTRIPQALGNQGNVPTFCAADQEADDLPLARFVARASSKFEQLPLSVREQLPAVSKSSLHALLHENEFVNFNELLPNNRTPTTATGDKTVVQDEFSGKLKVRSEGGKKETIDSFPAWSRAYSVFMAYRIAANANLALPLTKYFDHISQLAHPNR